jgi:hypothetical protein
MSALMYWTGFAVWLAVVAIVAVLIGLVVVHLADSAIFTCRIGRVRTMTKKPARPWIWLRTWWWCIRHSAAEMTFYPNGFHNAGVKIYWPRCAPDDEGRE